MEKKCGDDQRWVLTNSTENAVELRGVEEEEEEEDEEALSLSDLPLIHHSRKEKEEEEEEDDESRPRRETGSQDQDFDFCSKESEMCAADEVFFQGQILPLRHSISSEKGLLYQYRDSRNSISRSESMDHYYSSRLISSRSSSISSHNSSSSGSSSTTTTTIKYKPKLPPRNQFHSHPSPSPKLHFPSYKQGTTNTNHRNSIKKSSVWNILRLGLVTTPPEIAFHDLKTRNNSKNFGSRNSSNSNCSSVDSSKKSKARALLGGCKCSVDAVDTVASRVVIIKRSASNVDEQIHLQQEENVNVDAMKLRKKQATKKQLSHHRTFEWLKQLSVEGTGDDEA